MAKTIKAMGLKAYLDDVYAKEGGYARFIKLLDLEWPKEQIAQEFGISRGRLYEWIEEKNKGKEPNNVRS